MEIAQPHPEQTEKAYSRKALEQVERVTRNSPRTDQRRYPEYTARKREFVLYAYIHDRRRLMVPKKFARRDISVPKASGADVEFRPRAGLALRFVGLFGVWFSFLRGYVSYSCPGRRRVFLYGFQGVYVCLPISS